MAGGVVASPARRPSLELGVGTGGPVRTTPVRCARAVTERPDVGGRGRACRRNVRRRCFRGDSQAAARCPSGRPAVMKAAARCLSGGGAGGRGGPGVFVRRRSGTTPETGQTVLGGHEKCGQPIAPVFVERLRDGLVHDTVHQARASQAMFPDVRVGWHRTSVWAIAVPERVDNQRRTVVERRRRVTRIRAITM